MVAKWETLNIRTGLTSLIWELKPRNSLRNQGTWLRFKEVQKKFQKKIVTKGAIL